jgi:hypothetical protein
MKSQPKSTGQLSGKYYRTRSLSQNLQQIFHPKSQSHSRSINNLSIIGSPNYMAIKPSTLSPPKSSFAVPQSLPQSPRIFLDTPTSSPFFPSLHSQQNQHSPLSPNFVYPNFNYPAKTVDTKLKSFQLSRHRMNKYMRSVSAEVQPIKPTILSFKQHSLEERKKSDKFFINDVLKENDELLRRYSETRDESPPSSLSLFQNAFKSKFASIFKHKKKYKINDASIGKESGIYRCDSSQSLPTLVSDEKKLRKKGKKSQKEISKNEKLKSLNLNPPQMIGGSFDNLLLINRVNKKKCAIGSYDTYHGRPLMSQTSRLKALYKYRKPSESDDATTMSFEYDSGDVSDNSSIEHSSSDEGSSSFSDLTNKSSSRDYKIHSSVSIHSMPRYRKSRSRTMKIHMTAQSPLSSNNQFSFNPRAQQQSSISFSRQTSNISNQISSPTILQMPKISSNAANHNQAIKAYFMQHASGQASSEDIPLVRDKKIKTKK